MDDHFRESFQAAYMELGGLGERVLGKKLNNNNNIFVFDHEYFCCVVTSCICLSQLTINSGMC